MDTAGGPLRTAAELASVLDDVPAVIAFFDMDLRNRFTNWAHVPWFGLHPHELVGCSPGDIVGAATFAESKPYYDAVREGHSQTFERINTLPGGARRHSLVTYVPFVVAGEVRGVVTMASDVTGRVRAEFARQELAARAAAIGARELSAIDKQRAATETLNQMAAELAAVADRHPAHAAAISEAARSLGDAARRLRALVAHRPGPGRPPGPERIVRERVERATDRLGFAPSLLVMGTLDDVDHDLALQLGHAMDVTLDNVARHAEAGRVEVTVSIEHGDLVLVVSDDGQGLIRPQPGSGLDRLRQVATERDGSCLWHINADGGTTVEWRVPVRASEDEADAVRVNGVLAGPVDGGQRAPDAYRDGTQLGLDAEEMRLLLEHVPVGLAVWDHNFTNQYVNELAARWLGQPDAAAVIGRNYRDLVHRSAYDRVTPLARAALAGAHVVVERPFAARDAERPQDIRAEFLPRRIGGRVAGVSVQVTDVGARIRAESAVRAEQARIAALRARYAAEEEIHHLAIQEVFAAAMRLDTLRHIGPDALAELDNALAPMDQAIADLRESVMTTEPLTT